MRRRWKRPPRDSRDDGGTAMFVSIDGKPAGVIAVADPIKATTHDALQALRADGIRIVMLTGDNRTTALAVARRLGIDEVEADVLPERKHAIVKRLRSEGRVVAMAGDGVERRACAGRGQRGHRDGNRHRCRHAQRRRDAGKGRPRRHRAGADIESRHHAQHPPEPRARLRLQRAGHPAGRRRVVSRLRAAAQPRRRRGGDEPELAVRHRQCAATSRLLRIWSRAA